MTILVTGATGFVGRNLVEGLRTRHRVLSPTHAELDLLDGRAVAAWLNANPVDVVVHAAVRGGPAVLQQTLRMQANLVSLVGTSFARLLYFGSGAEFAKTRDLRKVREDELGKHLPADDYGLAKLHLCEQARARATRDVIDLRLLGVYGPHEGYLFKFISNAIAKSLLGLEIVVRQDVRFDYLWIGDLVPVVEHFVSAPAGPAAHADYNVTPTESVTLSGITEMVNACAAAPSSVRFETPGMNFEYTADNARLRAELPALRFTSMKVGIAALYEFYRKDVSSLDREAIVQDDYARRANVREAAKG